MWILDFFNLNLSSDAKNIVGRVILILVLLGIIAFYVVGRIFANESTSTLPLTRTSTSRPPPKRSQNVLHTTLLVYLLKCEGTMFTAPGLPLKYPDPVVLSDDKQKMVDEARTKHEDNKKEEHALRRAWKQRESEYRTVEMEYAKSKSAHLLEDKHAKKEASNKAFEELRDFEFTNHGYHLNRLGCYCMPWTKMWPFSLMCGHEPWEAGGKHTLPKAATWHKIPIDIIGASSKFIDRHAEVYEVNNEHFNIVIFTYQILIEFVNSDEHASGGSSEDNTSALPPVFQ